VKIFQQEIIRKDEERRFFLVKECIVFKKTEVDKRTGKEYQVWQPGEVEV
jgi:hypothetical protein